jgi:hypothetical protein
MKLTYQTSTVLDKHQIFEILRQYLEKETGKQLANFYHEETDNGLFFKIYFTDETVELK